MLILRRFDRTSTGARIGYISAMTAVGSSDGEQRDYADIAEAMRDLSHSPRQDHRESCQILPKNPHLRHEHDEHLSPRHSEVLRGRTG